MKVRVTWGGEDVTVELGDAPGSATRVNGELLPADVRRIAPGLYSVLLDGRSYEVTLEPSESPDAAPGDVAGPVARGATTEVIVGVEGRTGHLQVEDERTWAARAAAAAAISGPAAAEVTVAAPMPGRVAAVPVAVGVAVERGQTVVVLEAMKMESALTTPRAGRVAEVMVSPGQAVQRRQALVRIVG